MTKKQLREHLEKKRSSITPELRSKYSKAIWQRVEQTEVFQNAKHVACYAHFRSEVQTLQFFENYPDKHFYLPRTKGKEMEFLLYCKDDTFQVDDYGIMIVTGDKIIAPEKLDLILAPGLGFTQEGGRIGYGAGYYDRYLKKTSCPALGLAFEEQILEELPLDPWDHLLQAVITEKRILLPKEGSIKFNTDENRVNTNLLRKNENKEDTMQKWICTACNYIYDPAIGDEDGGIEPGTAFEDIPEDWVCPDCGVGKDFFEPYED